MTNRLGGWQCWVDVYDDYVIKTFKTRQEITESVRKYLTVTGRINELDQKVDLMLTDVQTSIQIIKTTNIPKTLLANLEFLNDGTIKQSRVTTLGERLNNIHKVTELETTITKLINLIHTLWTYGIHEKTQKFNSNMGILNNEVVLIDPFEITDSEQTVLEQLSKKSWQKRERYKGYLKDDAINYLIKNLNENLTEEVFYDKWKSRMDN